MTFRIVEKGDWKHVIIVDTLEEMIDNLCVLDWCDWNTDNWTIFDDYNDEDITIQVKSALNRIKNLRLEINKIENEFN